MMFSWLENKLKDKLYYNKLLKNQVIAAYADLNKTHSAIVYKTHKCASTFVYKLFEVSLKMNTDPFRRFI